ncbi:MAG: SRPBCC domain-containing protein [Anaerolineae bacterium]|nr:SRPBCC domain-containing protein [Anaerolineae bacterium]
MRPVGSTKSQGWEIGVRRTFPVSAARAWDALMSKSGLELWFGDDPHFAFKKGESFKTQIATGEIRSYTEGSLVRMTWQPPEWDFISTLQIRVLPAKTGATISIHHEKMQNNNQREAMRQHWTAVLDELGRMLKGT